MKKYKNKAHKPFYKASKNSTYVVGRVIGQIVTQRWFRTLFGPF